MGPESLSLLIGKELGLIVVALKLFVVSSDRLPVIVATAAAATTTTTVELVGKQGLAQLLPEIERIT